MNLSMTMNTKCSNCSIGTQFPVHQIVITTRKKVPQVVSVSKMLASIYKLNYLDNLPVVSEEESLEEQQHSDAKLCGSCAKILTDIYKSHEEFTQVRRLGSFLAKKMDKLDSILDQMQSTWSEMMDNIVVSGESSNYSKEINTRKEEESTSQLLELLQESKTNESFGPERKKTRLYGLLAQKEEVETDPFQNIPEVSIRSLNHEFSITDVRNLDQRNNHSTESTTTIVNHPEFTFCKGEEENNELFSMDDKDCLFENNDTLWTDPHSSWDGSQTQNQMDKSPMKNNHSYSITKDNTREENFFAKPFLSYAQLIALTLKNSRSGKLGVQKIYKFISHHFPYYKSASRCWQNSIRHSLSQNKWFEKYGGQMKGVRKLSIWGLNPVYIPTINEILLSQYGRNREEICKVMSDPENLEMMIQGELKDWNGWEESDFEAEVEEESLPEKEVSTNTPRIVDPTSQYLIAVVPNWNDEGPRRPRILSPASIRPKIPTVSEFKFEKIKIESPDGR